MKTKIQPAETSSYSFSHTSSWGPFNPLHDNMKNYTSGQRRITYGEGPKYVNFRCNWKPCYQECINVQPVPQVWHGTLSGYRNGAFSSYDWTLRYNPETRNYAIPPSYNDLPETWAKVHDNLDLNARDPVLLYSGILQAVPLVGGALKFTSVLNKAARKLSKSFKQKPFTTVVKSLISADFIDRFVISPTIDDARKFLDAHNYVVNIMNTMYERSGPLPTAISMETVSKDVKTSTSYSQLSRSSSQIRPDQPRFYYATETGIINTTKVFLLAGLEYNTSSVDPIKLWMARCGILSPLDSVWDLVPFSFVIDYFTRAGEFIAGLGERMSRQEGLIGKIRTIYGSWSTIKNFNGVRRKVTSVDDVNFRQSGWTQVTKTSEILAPVTEYGSYRFVREPSNPWAYPMNEPSGLLHWDLTKVRARTLLELVIQAKL